MSAKNIEVKTEQFQFAHGKKPRGHGMWGFEIAGVTYFYTGTYTDAVNSAIKMAVIKGVRTIKVCS